jgi:tRNA pseudouridine55 synthase
MTRRRSGILVVDKGAGVTSFQAVAQLKRVLRPTKIGHGGTLDPAATGVLPILIGEATKLSPYLMDHDKEYRATIRFGVTTDTQDLTGTVVATAPVPALARADIERACAGLVGVIAQVPPMYSAVHHEGRRLYELARAGVEVERAAREIVVHSIAVEDVALPSVTLRIVCGKGTYVRALAGDLGEALGVGGAVEHLVRTRVGPFRIGDAVAWSDVEAGDADRLWARVLPPDAAVAGYPEVSLDGAAAEALRHGQSVRTDGPDPGSVVRVYGAGQTFLGIGRMLPGGRVKPERLLHADHPGIPVVPA